MLQLYKNNNNIIFKFIPLRLLNNIFAIYKYNY